ncbi:MAG: HPP family protein [Candidatus Sumerlaeota bacterium]
MADNITARDLIKASFLRLGETHSLREAMGILLDPQAQKEEPRVLTILNPEGKLEGILTTRHLLMALLPEWVEEEQSDISEEDFEQRLLEAMQDKLDITVRDAMLTDIPLVAPDARLPDLIEILQDRRLDCVPVLENERIIGVVFLTDVYTAAAQLALASQHEAE